MENREGICYNGVNFNYRGENMELGEKILQARLEAGLSQRQLCGDAITRNMLSQIEHGTARPSMKTLAYLAERLGKPISYFLEDAVDTAALEDLSKLRQAEEALQQGRHRLAAELLETVNGEALRRQKLLLQSRIPGADPEAICDRLPSLDDELYLRADAAFRQGKWSRCLHLLEAMEERTPQWYQLRGRLCIQEKDFARAAEYLLQAEQDETVYRLLEQCYRELEDYKQAYFYACKLKK